MIKPTLKSLQKAMIIGISHSYGNQDKVGGWD